MQLRSLIVGILALDEDRHRVPRYEFGEREMMSAALGLVSWGSQMVLVDLLESPRMPLFTHGSCARRMSMDSSAAVFRATADAPLQ